jgi:transposase
MKYNQNARILQQGNEKLIVGVDVASVTNYARAFDNRGVEQSKVFKFDNDAEGFERFAEWIGAIQEKSGKNDVTVGMEPTGHYWFTMEQYLRGHNMGIVLVNPYHVKRCKELDDNSPTKNDRKDPKTIAMLVKDGRYMKPYIPESLLCKTQCRYACFSGSQRM